MTESPKAPRPASLVEPVPPALEAALAQRFPASALRARLLADLTPGGAFGEEWVLVAGERLEVVQAAGQSLAPRLALDLSRARRARAEQLVGCGALIVEVDGAPAEVCRYSNAQARQFARLARHLDDLFERRRELELGKPARPEPTVAEDVDGPRRCPTCGLILPEGTRVCPACMSKARALRRMASYLKPYWRQLLVIWALMVLSTLLALVPPYLTQPLLDRVLAPRDAAAAAPLAERQSLLGWLVLGLLGALAATQVGGALRGRTLISLSTRLSHDLRMEVFRQLHALSLRFFDRRQTGALITRVTRDTQSFENVLVESLQYFIFNLVLLGGIGAVLFHQDWLLATLVLLPAPVVYFLSRHFWKKVITLWHRSGHLHSRLSATTADSLSGVRVVKAFATEAREVSRFEERSTASYRADREADQAWTTLFPIIWFLISTGALLVWYFGGRKVLSGEMKIGELMMFIAYLGMFYGPMQYLSQSANYLARSLAAAERVFEVLDSRPDVADTTSPVPLPRVAGKVEFRGVTFGYDAHKPVLKEISFVAEPGELIGLVGQSGSGKSTLINLICRFYDPQEGQVLVDGQDIRRVLQEDLRSQVGVVLQDPFLFNGTLAENIAYGKPGASREEIMAAAKAANAHDFIVERPDGYDTQVGERGQSLSGGERQRISIARAILHDPRILILDEATSSVDTDTEKEIQEALARLTRGRTTFAIAHRLSTLRRATRLIVLKDGKIQEQGTHTELLGRQGEFHRLVTIQEQTSKILQV